MTNNSIPAKYLTRKFQRICVRSILIILTGLNFCLRAQAAETDEATRLQKLEQAVLELQQENKSLKQEVSALKARPSTSLSPKAAVERYQGLSSEYLSFSSRTIATPGNPRAGSLIGALSDRIQLLN